MVENLKQFKILFVDDEPEIREIISEQIVNLGYTCITATGMPDALKLLPNHHSDTVLIIADLNMPGGSGLELRQAVLEKYRDIPFVILSGNITKDLALKALELKIAAFIDKPASVDTLKKLITKEVASRIAQIGERQALESTFFQEAGSLLEDLEPLVLSLEQAPNDPNTINTIFRLIHTVKGSSGVLEDNTIYKFGHKFEDFLSRFKSGSVMVTPDAISAMLSGCDVLKNIVKSQEQRDGKNYDIESLIKNIEQSSVGAKSQAVQQAQTDNKEKSKAAPPSTAREDIRVPSTEFDRLMELSGEITVIRNMVNKIVRSIEKSFPGNKDVGLLSELLEEMHKINGSVQNKIVDLRKSPLSQTFRPIPRTIRDLSKALNKELSLAIKGEELRVDTSISKALSDSIIHLIRNSADHGIESPDARKASGKSKTGQIFINCREEREEVIVEVGDDGKGLDIDRIKKKILENGLATPDALAVMPPSKIYAQIFESGFSTAQSVSEVSGRGVGMDMVRNSIERLSGRIDISTEVGKGTKFTLHIPIPKTVLIINSLLISVHNQTFAVPQDNIVRLLCRDSNIQAKSIVTLEGGRVLRTEGEIIPLVNLREILKFPKLEQPAEELNIVVTQFEGTTYGLIVDAILDGEDVVVKPIGQHLVPLKAYGGATFLGDGSVGLILDMGGLAELAKLDTGSLEDQAINDSQAAKITLNEYLVVSLARDGLYTVPLSEVYRIEDINSEEIKYSGFQKVVIYREQLMPVYDLSLALNFGAGKNLNDLKTQVVVTKIGDRFFGLIVNAIVDIASTDTDVDQQIRDRPGILGTTFIGGESATVVDIKEVLTTVGAPLPKETQAPPLVPVQESGSPAPEPPKEAQVISITPPKEPEPAPMVEMAEGWGLF